MNPSIRRGCPRNRRYEDRAATRNRVADMILGEARLLQIDTGFDLVAAAADGEVALDAPVEKVSRLVLRRRRVGEGITAAVVEELVLPHVGVDGEEDVRAEGVLEAGRDAPGEDALALILRELVVAVGNLDPVAGGEQVKVEDVALAGLVIEAVKDGLVVAFVVERGELGRVEEAAAAGAVQGKKVAGFGIAETEAD